MKKSILNVTLNSILLSSALIITGCGDSKSSDADVFEDKKVEVSKSAVEKNVAIKEQSVEQNINSNDKSLGNKPNNLNNKKEVENFKDYSSFQTKVKDVELQKLIDETIKEYETILTTIDTDRAVQEKEITEPRQQNINELKLELAKEEENKQKECQSITTANEEACTIIEKNILGIKNVITEIENDITNLLGQLDVVTLNNKRKLNAQMKSNVSKLVSHQKS